MKVKENKTAMEMIKEQEPSCYGDIELLMKDYAKQKCEILRISAAKVCDNSIHPSLMILQINIDKLLT